MAVKFLKAANVGTLYNEGEIASFDAATEKALIDEEIAEAVKPAKEAEKR